MTTHTKKISKLLNVVVDVDEHIVNISTYKLTFFQKLVLCLGLKFAIPQNVSQIEIQASFEKAYWRLEPTLKDEQKNFAKTTLKSIALNYRASKSRKFPKLLKSALKQLKHNKNIVITKPDKGSVVVIMDKSEYIHLLSEASISDQTKFTAVRG